MSPISIATPPVGIAPLVGFLNSLHEAQFNPPYAAVGTQAMLIERRFQNADFRSGCFDDAYFRNCDFLWVDFRGSSLLRVFFKNVQAANSDFRGANLQEAAFTGHIENTDFRHANLKGVVMEATMADSPPYLDQRGWGQ